MRPRTLVFITLLVLCHPQVDGQRLTNGLPLSQSQPAADPTGVQLSSSSSLPDDPGQELLPVAKPEPAPASGTPIEWEAENQTWIGDTVTLSGKVVLHYRDYVLTADEVTYNRATTELQGDHIQVTGGPEDVLIDASHGEMRLNMHTARFYDVHGSQGVRTLGHTVVYSTPNPLLFSGRVLIQTGEGDYKLIDGEITNCRLPHPDWRILSHSIALANGAASTSNSVFEFLDVPVFYLPYLRHAAVANGRTSGFLIPVISNGSSIRGYTLGEQVYWAINRSMDMVLGAEYFSKRGWAPNGDFRYKGPGLDHLIARWNALLDRGVEEAVTNAQTGQVTNELVNQGGEDVAAEGIRTFSPETRLAGTAEYLSSYVYRLVFNDNYTQATSSQVSSDVAFTHARNGRIPSASLDRFQTFASTTNGDEVRILHLPNLRYDVLDKPLAGSHVYWGLASSLDYLSRSEPDFHARNVGRFDFYPHIVLPLEAGGWSLLAEAAVRDTSYTISQHPDLTGANSGVPTISHDPLSRHDVEASVDLRPPPLEREFVLPWGNRVLRHVIEPELTYRYVTGIGPAARNALLFDTTDIATDTSQVGYSFTQRFFLRPENESPCDPDAPDAGLCPAQPREWATWQIAQEFFIDPNFGGALIPGRRNVFASTLDLSAIAFLTSPRNLSPLISRLRFEAIHNLRVEWDFDYDPKRGQMDADNLFAGYSWGRTTLGVGHALLNAVDENTGGASLSTLKSQLVKPFLEFGKPSGKGFDLAVNGGYDFAQHTLQYAGAEAVYNWDCCGLTLGYRRFQLGTVGTVSRDETQWLYSFTLANFGVVGDIRRANSVFRDPTLPPAY